MYLFPNAISLGLSKFSHSQINLSDVCLKIIFIYIFLIFGFNSSHGDGTLRNFWFSSFASFQIQYIFRWRLEKVQNYISEPLKMKPSFPHHKKMNDFLSTMPWKVLALIQILFLSFLVIFLLSNFFFCLFISRKSTNSKQIVIEKYIFHE